MPNLELPRIVGLPGTYEQAEREVIEPAGEQHFPAAEKVFEAFEREQVSAFFRAGEELKRKNSGSDQQDDGHPKRNGLGVLPVGRGNQKQPGEEDEDAGV